MSWENELQQWSEAQSAPPPSDADMAALLAAARRRRHRPDPGRVAMGVALVVAAATVVLAVWLPGDVPVAQRHGPPIPPAAAEGGIAASPSASLAPGTHELGADEVVVGPGGSVAVVSLGAQTRLQLSAGTLEATVAPRGDGEGFTVDADAWRVDVVGTRFRVTREPFRVAVLEGVVEVVRGVDGARWKVQAGDAFSELDLPIKSSAPPREPPAPPMLERLQDLLLAGDVDGARRGIEARLSSDPEDWSSWMLLARLEERAGERDAAVMAWRRVVSGAGEGDAQLARFESARLLAERPEEARALLEEFLSRPHPLEGEARLQLAAALERLGESDAARATLEDAAARHAGTAVGLEARRRLEP